MEDEEVENLVMTIENKLKAAEAYVIFSSDARQIECLCAAIRALLRIVKEIGDFE